MSAPVKRPVTIFGAGPVHPGRGEPSYISLNVSLDYIKGGHLSEVRMTQAAALKLAEQLIRAALVVPKP